MRVLGVGIAPGFSKTNMWACWTLGLMATMVISFLPTATPYLLGGVLGVPAGAQGRMVGLLGFAAELTMIASLAWYGALADRYGRRPLVVAGFVLCALGAALFPFAGDTTVLVALRVVFALGAAALGGMFATIAMDYAREDSRGRSYGVLGVFCGLGGLVAVLALARLPRTFEAQGMSPAAASRVSFLAVAAGLLVAAVVMRFALSPARVSVSAMHVPLPRLVREGVTLFRDPGAALAYVAAFVARADLAVIAGFMSLWIVDHATRQGMGAAEALARAGMIVGIAHTMALVSSPVLGWLGDRVRRQNLVIGAQLVAALSYLSTLLISDPLGPGMIVVAMLVGVGEIAGINTAGPLLAQQAPARMRGSAFGVQALMGALGIMCVSALGGLLYDHWRPAAPFVVSGGLGLCVVAFGLVIRRRVVPNPEATTATDQDPRSARTPAG
ncbi:MFS transporter [Nonomuraea africana]|uniref:MFS family permease n=1 Tax=Nonomuraea africana TaxID=46171 RepID=A0ABR9KT95_9ACTN|nr:MFS transporter [Nonomuraea africana]MBE1565250.1 MFS family permease [Nonomuraea africana]